jgi:hypothetical protein
VVGCSIQGITTFIAQGSIIDFAKNYTFAYQNEIQEAQWHSMSITILVHIIYLQNPNADLEKLET